MEQLLPQQFNQNFRQQFLPHQPGAMGHAGRPTHQTMINPSSLVSDHEEKKREFARGVYVSGFEKTLTVAMLHQYFSIKPIQAIKMPLTKFSQNKSFAFIYYGSQDDALYVKKTLDRTVILKNSIRVTRTVVSENISKMMFKLKTHGLSEAQIEENEKKYFNEEFLEAEVQKIIKPLFGSTLEVNKIVIPFEKSVDTKLIKPLRYARVFFYIADVKGAFNIAKRSAPANQIPPLENSDKNVYEVILDFIYNLLNKAKNPLRQNQTEYILGSESIPIQSTGEQNKIFYLADEINIQKYSFLGKNKDLARVMQLKGIKHKNNEDMSVLAEEIKQYLLQKNPQLNIVSIHAKVSQHKPEFAWANITFQTRKQTVQTYKWLSSERPKFRDGLVYGSIKNGIEQRTVMISTVKKDVNESDTKAFFKYLAEKSVIVQGAGSLGNQTNHEANNSTIIVKKYDLFDYNILEETPIWKDNQGLRVKPVEGVDCSSYRLIKILPKRMVIHFFIKFDAKKLFELATDVKISQQFHSIFLSDPENHVKVTSPKGHFTIFDNYIAHVPNQPKVKSQRVPRKNQQIPKNIGRGNERNYEKMAQQQNRSNRPTQPKIDYKAFIPGQGGIPKFQQQGGYNPMRQNIPQVGTHPQYMPKVIGGNIPQIGQSVPAMGGVGLGQNVPVMGGQNMPNLGGQNVPVIGGQNYQPTGQFGQPPFLGQQNQFRPPTNFAQIGSRPMNPQFGQPQIGMPSFGQPPIGLNQIGGQNLPGFNQPPQNLNFPQQQPFPQGLMGTKPQQQPPK